MCAYSMVSTIIHSSRVLNCSAVRLCNISSNDVYTVIRLELSLRPIMFASANERKVLSLVTVIVIAFLHVKRLVLA